MALVAPVNAVCQVWFDSSLMEAKPSPAVKAPAFASYVVGPMATPLLIIGVSGLPFRS